MIAKEFSTSVREKAVTAAPTAERAGEGVKLVSANPAGAVAAGVAPDGRASSDNVAPPAYVPPRRRSRRNLLL